MWKNKKFVDVFINLGDFPWNTDTFDVLEEFSCCLYSYVKQNDVHEVTELHFNFFMTEAVIK